MLGYLDIIGGNEQLSPLPRRNSNVAPSDGSWKLTARMKELSVALNKDEQNRRLVRLSMHDAVVTVKGTSGDKVKAWGQLGRLIAVDCTEKESNFRQLLGLQNNETESLVVFEYSSQPGKDHITSGMVSKLTLEIDSISAVYLHQQILELVDYLLEGILGAIVQVTLQSAAAALLETQQGDNELWIKLRKPQILIPVDKQRTEYLILQASILELTHVPAGTLVLENIGRIPVDLKKVVLNDVEMFTFKQDQLLHDPIALSVSILDVLKTTYSSETTTFIPRFDVRVEIPKVHFQMTRETYHLLVDILEFNLGGDEVDDNMTIMSHRSSKLRPTVAYLYADPTLEAVTFKLCFELQETTCLLLSKNKEPFLQLNMKSFGVSLLNYKAQAPVLIILMDSLSILSMDTHVHSSYRKWITCSSPCRFTYQWQEHNSHDVNVVISLKDVEGIVVLSGIMDCIDFFQLPEQDKTSSSNLLNNDDAMSDVVSTSSDEFEMAVATVAELKEKQKEHYLHWDIKVKFEAKGWKVRFLESFTKESCHQVVISTDIDFIFSYLENTKYSFKGTAFPIQVVIANTTRYSLVQIIEPTQVSFTCNSSSDVGMDESAELVVSPIDIFLSYQNFLVFEKVFQLLEKSMTIPRGRTTSFAQHIDVLSEPIPSWKSIRRCIELKMDDVQLTIINDCAGCDMPLVQLQLREGTYLFINGDSENYVAGGNIKFSALFYNVERGQWEILCDPWEIVPGITCQPGNPRLNVHVSAKFPLTVAINSGLLKAAAATASIWEHRQVEDLKSPYLLKNETGFPIQYWLNDSTTDRVELLSLQVHNIHFEHTRDKGFGVARHYDRVKYPRCIHFQISEEYSGVLGNKFTII